MKGWRKELLEYLEFLAHVVRYVWLPLLFLQALQQFGYVRSVQDDYYLHALWVVVVVVCYGWLFLGFVYGVTEASEEEASKMTADQILAFVFAIGDMLGINRGIQVLIYMLLAAAMVNFFLRRGSG